MFWSSGSRRSGPSWVDRRVSTTTRTPGTAASRRIRTSAIVIGSTASSSASRRTAIGACSVTLRKQPVHSMAGALDLGWLDVQVCGDLTDQVERAHPGGVNGHVERVVLGSSPAAAASSFALWVTDNRQS